MIDVTATEEIANDARVKANVARLGSASAHGRQFRGDFRNRFDCRCDQEFPEPPI